MKEIDFSLPIDLENKEEIYTFFNGEQIIFIDYKKYDGPITMQFLPNGGIQSLFAYNIIIKTEDCFLSVTKLRYKNVVYSSKDFIDKYGDITNLVLPN